MILNVDFDRSTWKPAPHRFEAGTPNMAGAVGLHAAMDYLDHLGRDQIARHDQELGAYAYAKLAQFKHGIRLFGPPIGRAGLVISNVPYLVPDKLTVWDAAAAPSSQMFMLVGTLLMPVSYTHLTLPTTHSV